MAKPGTDQASNSYTRSSSSLKVGDDCFESFLLSIDLERASTDSLNKFTLTDLCARCHESDEENFYLFVKENCPKHISVNCEIHFKDQFVYSLFDQANFLSSCRIKPDLFITSKESLPLLFVEIVSSSSPRNTQFKSVSNLVDQLRYLRSVYEISSVVGYVIPNHREPGLATKILVEWRDLQFNISFVDLNKEDFLKDFQAVMQEQCHDWLSLPKLKCTGMYFIRLSELDLKILQQKVNSVSVVQDQSKFSILLRDDRFYYKILPRDNVSFVRMISMISIRDNAGFKDMTFQILLSPEEKTSLCHIVLPDMFFEMKFFIYKFPRQPYDPLTKHQAKGCLGDLLAKVWIALSELHKFGYAHCDVRLPNICFSLEGDVRLIDLDRVEPVQSTNLYAGNCFMHICNESVGDLDTKQLGIMIFAIKFETNCQQKDLKSNDCNALLMDKDKLLRRMIFEFKVDTELLDAFVAAHPGSVIDVLNSRGSNTL